MCVFRVEHAYDKIHKAHMNIYKNAAYQHTAHTENYDNNNSSNNNNSEY